MESTVKGNNVRKIYLIFYGIDGEAAKELAVKMRADGCTAMLRHAEAYRDEVEPCDGVIALSDVSPYDRKRIDAAYGQKVARPVIPPPPVPLPLV